MGLDATVRCECWERGLCAPTELASLIEVDEEGYLDLRAPECDDHHLRQRFDSWQQTACRHPDMAYLRSHVSNWSGVSHFRHALTQAGAERFPVLLNELPTANGGLVPPETAREMLDEIHVFDGLERFGLTVALVDSDSGETIHTSTRDHPYFFSLSPNERLGIDAQGFLIVRDETIVFSSVRFEQDVLVAAGRDGSGETRFRCLDSGAFAIARIAVAMLSDAPDRETRGRDWRPDFRYPKRLHVEHQAILPSDFAYILDPLAELCEAAIQTGNPIRWC